MSRLFSESFQTGNGFRGGECGSLEVMKQETEAVNNGDGNGCTG